MGSYRYVSLREFLDRACADAGSSTFLHVRGKELTYADVGAATDGAAAEWLRLGIGRGARVALLVQNGPEHVLAWLSLAKIGAIAAPIHPDFSSAEIAEAMALLEPDALVHDTTFDDRLAGIAGAIASVRVRLGARDLDTILASREPLRDAPAPRPEDVAEILMTSGTTGKSKAVLQTHRTSVVTGEAFAHWLGLDASDRLFTCLPLSHINARSYSTMGAIAARASLALEMRFSASRFWSQVRDAGATEANTIGAMLHILLGQPESESDRDHRLRIVYTAPSLSVDAHLAFERRFGVRLVAGYGLTESTFGFIHPLSGSRHLESMGKPRRHPDPSVPAEWRLVAEGKDAADGEPGEIWLRNPASFSGYFRDEDATRATIVDRWVRTGDLATRDAEGFYTFRGRIKQLIRRRGENVSPAEVEAVLERHPCVVEAAVVGIPSPLGEEDIRAYVVLRKDRTASADDLAGFCREWLAAFKVPSEWRFLDALPRTPTKRIAYAKLPED
jgi:crotonobetaine/carnitine-CoA ligase